MPPIVENDNLVRKIEDMIVSSWRNGSSAGSVLSSILNNQEIQREVEEQLTKHLTFVQGQKENRITEYAERRFQSTKEHYAKRQQELEEKYNTELEALQNRHNQSYEEMLIHEKAFNQAQSELSDLQEEIAASLGKARKFSSSYLNKINDMVVKDAKPETVHSANINPDVDSTTKKASLDLESKLNISKNSDSSYETKKSESIFTKIGNYFRRIF